MIKNEDGLTLIEVLVAVVILGTSFMLLASMLVRNQQMIELNEKKKEAQYIRDELREWIGYRAQTQDLAGLNQYVFSVKDSERLTNDQKIRRNYLILDNSGIQTNSGNVPIYGEQEIDLTDRVDKTNETENKQQERKIEYNYPDKARLLPEKWKDADEGSLEKEESNYLGRYIGTANQHTYLVLCKVGFKNTSSNYDPRRDGVEVVLEIYDEKTGQLITETLFNWVITY
ncbi:prepilin-type N-terminal cleavage/methylation domain-containing protein [Enterococcus ureasiticus]|uniref:type IV pilus modification PilV family protein n=1 Tax=Enterococcus ureasiticus TaxID=903984 RepID=UPI001A8D45D4|nr:prepilin-type N-terminal cleavage/methylation domain-containing protein [Enterococcus ureasiticus]MBO0475009.1 prepilin-type N-terminal cleavage/methylation domain-containing protein [Enterococcus ureasiticus]